MISIKRSNNNNINTEEDGFSIKFDSKNIKIKAPDISEEGTIVQNKNGKRNVIRYRKSYEEFQEQEDNIFYVNALEGNPAFINMGQLIPVRNQTTVVTSGATVVQENIEHHNVSSGFYVTPKLQGKNVTLAISPHFAKINQKEKNIINVQNISTTIYGKLGEWMPIGGVDQSQKSSDKKNLVNKKQYGNEKSSIFVKVEEVE